MMYIGAVNAKSPFINTSDHHNTHIVHVVIM